MGVDTIIVNGSVLQPTGPEQVTISIHGGRVVGLHAPGTAPDGEEVIDAAGRLVLPGLVDMHSHHREPGFEHKEDLHTVSQACAAGGVTTTVAMPNVFPPPNDAPTLDAMMELYDSKMMVDWNINPAGTKPEEMPALAERGIAAFKVFMVTDTGRDYPHMPGIGVHDHGELMKIMETCAAVDVPLMVHPHDQALMDHVEAAYWERGERDALAYARAYAAHDGLIWETAIALLLRMQAATGVHLHLLHVQTAGSVEMIRAAKAQGRRVTAEINPWALFLGNDWSNIERLGSYALSYWVPDQNTQALWDGFNDATIDIVATDHAPHTREEKDVGWEDGWAAHTGTPSTQFFLSMFLDAAANGLTSLERVVEATSVAPAQIFHLDRKGSIRVGADADIVIVDPNRVEVITDELVLSRCGWTPYAGMKVRGWPVRTLVRGATVYKDGTVAGTFGTGRLAASSRPASVST